MAAIHTVYSNLCSTYGLDRSNRYDVHRNGELRQVYHAILQLNKASPLYQLRDQEQGCSFAIAIKSCSHEIQSIVSSLTDSRDGMQQTFRKRIAFSSQPENIAVDYIGSADEQKTGISIELQELATAQINTGKYLPAQKRNLSPGDYSFNLDTPTSSYEFQFYVESTDTNFEIQKKIASLVNQSHIGLNARLLANEKDEHALEICSDHTGTSPDQKAQFQISSGETAASEQALITLGIDHISHPASNAVFFINGTRQESTTNTYTANDTFELTFYHPTAEATPASIRFKPDADAILDQVQSLVDGYNHMLDTARNYLPAGCTDSRLLHIIQEPAMQQEKALSSVGLVPLPEGDLSIDRSQLLSAIEKNGPKELYSLLTDFADSLNEKADEISLDPIRYADKVVIIYKNPLGDNFTQPYFTSLYAGMLYDYRC